MDIRRPTLSEFQEIINSFSSDGPSEPPVGEEDAQDDKGTPRTISPTGEENPDEMYVLLYYGQEGGGEGRAEDEEGGHEKKSKTKGKVRKRRSPKRRDDSCAESRREIQSGVEPEENTDDEDAQMLSNHVERQDIVLNKIQANKNKEEVADKEILEKELEDDSRLLEERLRSEEDGEEILAAVKEHINETEADIDELENVENRLREIEGEHGSLLGVNADSNSEHQVRMAMAREIRELKREVENLRNSLSIYQGQDETGNESPEQTDFDEALAVGKIAKSLYENTSLVEYFRDLQKQVAMANEMLVDLMSAHFSEMEISKHSELWLEHRLGRGIIQNPDFDGIFRYLNLGPGRLDEEYEETESEIEFYESDNFCITFGRLAKTIIEIDDCRQYLEELKRERSSDEGNLNSQVEISLGCRLLENDEVGAILDELKVLADGAPDRTSSEMLGEFSGAEMGRPLVYPEQCEKIEKEIDDKLETDPDIERKAELLMLKKRIIELKGPALRSKREGRLASKDADSDGETESDEDTTEVEGAIAFLEEAPRSKDARELWKMVEEKLKAIETDKVRITEAKKELDESMDMVRQLYRDLREVGRSAESGAKRDALRSKRKQIKNERYKLTEEYMKLDGEKMNLEAVVRRIEQEDRVLQQLTSVTETIERAKGLVRQVSARSCGEAERKETPGDGNKAESIMKRLTEGGRRKSEHQHAEKTVEESTVEEHLETCARPVHAPSAGYSAPLFISITAATALALFKILRSP